MLGIMGDRWGLGCVVLDAIGTSIFWIFTLSICLTTVVCSAIECQVLLTPVPRTALYGRSLIERRSHSTDVG